MKTILLILSSILLFACSKESSNPMSSSSTKTVYKTDTLFSDDSIQCFTGVTDTSDSYVLITKIHDVNISVANRVIFYQKFPSQPPADSTFVIMSIDVSEWWIVRGVDNDTTLCVILDAMYYKQCVYKIPYSIIQ